MGRSSYGEGRVSVLWAWFEVNSAKTRDSIFSYRHLVHGDYLEDFLKDFKSYPRTVILFRDQTHLGYSAEILNYFFLYASKNLESCISGRKLGYQPPDQSFEYQLRLNRLKRFRTAANSSKKPLMVHIMIQ